MSEALYSVNHLFRLIPFFIMLAAAVITAVLPSSRKFSYLVFSALAGFVAMCAAADLYDAKLVPDYSGEMTATVGSEIIVEDNIATFTVEDVYIDGKRLDGKAEVRFYLSGAPAFGAGDVIRLSGRLTSNAHEAFDSYFAYHVFGGDVFEIYATDAEFVADGEPSFPLNLQLAIKEMFFRNTDYDTATIAVALILGDKGAMDDVLYGDVKAAGMAHVLAVSGLHVTALATAVFWLLNKLRLNRKISFAVVLVLTFFYVALCSFTPSAIRAFVMTAVFNFGSVCGFKRDVMSSLCLAAFLIMLFNPFAVMHAGFLLSVFAVFGIVTFADPITSLFMKVTNRIAPSILSEKTRQSVPVDCGSVLQGGMRAVYMSDRAVSYSVFDREKRAYVTVKEKPLRRVLIRISEASAVAIASNLATIPFAAYFFGEVQTLFILSNVLILPYMMLIYTILLIITPFALITTLHGLAGIFDWLFLPFKAFSSAIGSVSFASVPMSVSVTGLVCYVLCLILVSRFVFLKRHEKAIAVLCTITAGLIVGTLAVLFS